VPPQTELDPRLTAKMFAEASLAADEYALALCLPDATPMAAPPPPDTAYVTHDGLVRACCRVMPDGPAPPGRLGDHTFAALWAGHANRLASHRG
jgi:hypothetical protein